jgi:hypothetical protein
MSPLLIARCILQARMGYASTAGVQQPGPTHQCRGPKWRTRRLPGHERTPGAESYGPSLSFCINVHDPASFEAHVRFGSEAAVDVENSDVCSALKSRRAQREDRCLFSATSGHSGSSEFPHDTISPGFHTLFLWRQLAPPISGASCSSCRQLPDGSPMWKPSFLSSSRMCWNRWYCVIVIGPV